MRRAHMMRFIGIALLACLLAAMLLTGAIAADHAECHCVYQAGCPVCLQVRSALRIFFLLALCALGIVIVHEPARVDMRGAFAYARALTPISCKTRLNN